jgi:catechol 2,3-dioxygenase-like lactoylglutathione lyase family enzyme
MVSKLHHMAFRCRDSEETRAFYEEVIGLKLVVSLPIEASATGRRTRVLHTFYALEDGSHVAFFEEPEAPFDFKPQRDFDLHIALAASAPAIARARAAAEARGLEVRGPSDHGMVVSTYFRDPNGYVVELCDLTAEHDAILGREAARARALLDAWRSEAAEIA